MRVLLLAAVLALAGVAAAENFSGTTKSGQPSPTTAIVGTGDYLDLQTAAFRSTIAVTDTLTTAGVLATTEFVLNGRQTLVVSPRFSSSGANCKIQVAYVSKTTMAAGASSTDTSVNKIKGWSDERTVTASTNQKEGSYYEAPDEYFTAEGAGAIRVLVTGALSGGSVTLWAGSK